MIEQYQDHADVKIHPPILLLIHLIAAFTLKWMIPIPLPVPPGVKAAGLLILTAGFLFAVRGLAGLIKSGTTFAPHEPVRTVVTNGAFRFSRNPI